MPGVVPGVVLSQHHLPRNFFFELWDPHLVFLDSEFDSESMHDLSTSFFGGSKNHPSTTSAPPKVVLGVVLGVNLLHHPSWGAVRWCQFHFFSSEHSEWVENTQLCMLITILGGARCPETVQKHLFLCLRPRPTLAGRWGP